MKYRHTYSFAKTPLKAAHAPLAAASGIQGSWLIVALRFDGAGDACGTAPGISGSASVSMAAGVDEGKEGWGSRRRREAQNAGLLGALMAVVSGDGRLGTYSS